MKEIHQDLFATLIASKVAAELSELLPNTDICDDLKTILNIQYEILCCMAEGEAMNPYNLKIFMHYCDQTEKQLNGMRGD